MFRAAPRRRSVPAGGSGDDRAFNGRNCPVGRKGDHGSVFEIKSRKGSRPGLVPRDVDSPISRLQDQAKPGHIGRNLIEFRHLKVGVIGSCRLQTGTSKLGGDEIGGTIKAGRRSQAAFQIVRGQKRKVGAQRIRRDAIDRCLLSWRQLARLGSCERRGGGDEDCKNTDPLQVKFQVMKCFVS